MTSPSGATTALLMCDLHDVGDHSSMTDDVRSCTEMSTSGRGPGLLLPSYEAVPRQEDVLVNRMA
ncbi:hypothetical protein Psi02_74670 [Planotetraspora silvatica]|uniref:Uncharacterized protein n=1 Tax=Planotetraspora silvatica TaxID=234614 RepID=A0A8J3US26_9ACTN|nr:hypothetical protein Psi02_74670 [Planotetraspora silvatica]